MKTIEMAKEIGEHNYWYPGYRSFPAMHNEKQIFELAVLLDDKELEDDIIDTDIEDLEDIDDESRFTFYVNYDDEGGSFVKENWQQITKEEVEKIYEGIQ